MSLSKKLFICCVSLIIPICSYSQIDDNSWSLSFSLGIQEHDNRLFDFPPSVSNRILKEQPGFLGTYQAEVGINRKIWSDQRIALSQGLSLGQEINSFKRPFSSCYLDKNLCYDWLVYTERFMLTFLSSPIEMKYKLGPKVSAILISKPQFWINKRVHYPPYNSSKNGFEFLAIEFIPGIEYHVGRIQLSIGYRIFQFRRKEETYSYTSNFMVNHPDYFKLKFETYNPVKFLLSVSYRFNFNSNKME